MIKNASSSKLSGHPKQELLDTARPPHAGSASRHKFIGKSSRPTRPVRDPCPNQTPL